MVLVYTTELGGDPNIVELVTTSQNVARPLLQELTTDIVTESPTAPNPGGSLTTTLQIIEEILVATDAQPGYRARFAWVNAASSRIGTTFAGVEVEAAPLVWTDPIQIPPGNRFEWRQTGAGGGSGSGCATRGASGTASLRGGGPSGGAAMNVWECTRADLIAALPIDFTTPLGGLGGASVSGTNIGVTPGNSGANGAANVISGVGLSQIAGGGGLGGAGGSSTTGAAGAGGGTVSSAAGATPGAPADVGPNQGQITFNSRGGCVANSHGSVSSGVLPMNICGGAGGGSNTNGSLIIHGGRSKFGGCGGGHGGAYSLQNGLTSPGSEGGNHDVTITGVPWGGGGGTAGLTNGESGGDGADGNVFEAGQGGGGGSGASGATAGSAIGGHGGRGGFPGGGSGGGGTGFSSGPSGQNATSGAGRDGGDALTLLTVLL
jgi:hypothetical protein